jgi:hypothetical protein
VSSIYRRAKLAAAMAQQLLHPTVLDEGLRSGLFLSGLRRTGKTTFLVNDLIPALEEAGPLRAQGGPQRFLTGLLLTMEIPGGSSLRRPLPSIPACWAAKCASRRFSPRSMSS